MTIALARPPMLRWLEAVTGCGPLTRVDGRVIQARANGIDALDWHDDRGNVDRRLAITIDLSDTGYDGGLFELREVASQRLLTTHRHDRPGSALIFDVADDIEHRVQPVTRGGPRRVYTGWFLGAMRPLP
ncbi:2OG-Fe(II) oxygenase [Sphingomonas sp. Leaf33]|uniref:2OG-Fe(II) oxygenase n=1 Tax=Sphingomonas sp. Leaf33 TaxID=1736215 RepID=UPI00138F8C1C|nr:2OG-Fe(II) oxygenase [Sphingomonas sp. Leaf33]